MTTDERAVNYHIQEYERCLKVIFPICSFLHGRQLDKSFAIIDVKGVTSPNPFSLLNEGVGFYHLTKDVRQMLATVTKIDQDNYPETLYHTCIINAPAAFRAIWAIVRPMLNVRTQAKVEVSNDIERKSENGNQVCPKDYLPALLKWIDIENIPEYLGGQSAGTLIDDVGPWKDPELIKQFSSEAVEPRKEIPKHDDNKAETERVVRDSVIEEISVKKEKEFPHKEETVFFSDPPKSNSSPLLPSNPDVASPKSPSPSTVSRTKALTGECN